MSQNTPSASKKIKIKTPRLIMRGARTAAPDYDGLHVGFSDPAVMRYWSNPPHKLREETEIWVTYMAANANNGVTDFVICERRSGPQQAVEVVPDDGTEDEEEGEVIGKIGVWAHNEIGYQLRASHWGRGLAKEALSAVLGYLFELPRFSKVSGEGDEEKTYDSIVADIDPRNETSIGMLKKFGFTQYLYQERTACIGGEWVDSVWLVLRREEWLRRQQG